MSVVTPPPRPATLDDLMRVEGKAELINGKVVEYMASDIRHNIVGGRVYRKLADHADDTGAGLAFTDGLVCAVPMLSSGRQSFTPDAGFHIGPLPANMRGFLFAPPTFAVEVRSEGDYGPTAERDLADKRADYFEAGTLVVWDVDPDHGWIDCYRASAPTSPQRFSPGDNADAEPAVPGWRLSVDWLMRP